jgi:carnitine 3-dehydrogenase
MTGVPELAGPVAVIGTGVIGQGWAALCLARGLDVVGYDPAPGAERRLRTAIEAAWPALDRLGLATGPAGRLSFAGTAREAASGAGFVQENGPEDAELKRQLIAGLDEAAGPGVVIASSSSGLRPSQLQQACGRHPQRVLAGHPFSPVHIVPLVEVVPGAATDKASVDATLALYRGLGKRPILVRRELPGHVVNRLQAALWQEAYSLVERGVVSVADLDAAISWGPGPRWALLGPLATQHFAGGPGGMAHVLEHLGPPAQEWMEDLGTARLSDGLTAALVDGVDAELAGVDQAALLAERDKLLVDLLTRKRELGI